eukprot:CAMPEP_0201507690 /NCGR_PEP_ID=MMETSP0161_2-20130828/1286_1 /ASSEMBLY_ACC=CAM_ASM_000251 /TAXON_ID=180227 /ORGANISM="Neoparamoeba aestuarina, Strain SoJaBio B1-5/56/2" /LENGTH=368 /DNA_ID=CAMNT_0047902125 /DNA_START=158 /DNA_END=1264 /DNA_ORIENTATION=-
MTKARWGFEEPMTAFGVVGQSLRVYQTRQQAQQPFYPWHSHQFSLGEFIPFRRGDVVNNGSLFRWLEGSAASFTRKMVDPYDLLERPYLSLLGEPYDVDSEVIPEEKEKKEKPKQRDTKLEYISLAASTGIASVVVHPLSLMGTWQVVQDTGRKPGFFFSPSTWTLKVGDMIKTYKEIQTNDKSFYDGLAATATYHVTFEVLKKKFKSMAYEATGCRSHFAEISRLNKEGRTLLDPAARAAAQKQATLLRWKKIAVSQGLNYLASVAAELVCYPLRTIALKLQAQGASFRFPVMYNGGLDCVSRVTQEEGASSLVAGISTLVCSVLPELVAAGCSYLIVCLVIEALSDYSRERILNPLLAFLEDDSLD